MIAQGSAVIFPVEQPAILEDRHHAINEGVKPILVYVRRHPEAVNSVCLEPFSSTSLRC
ncbi:hypothetical protein SRABI83_00049 [Arthrobacter sp. Bi83]|nr:hypothetical protein SRABI83_00049 [Arthrobacter sp. Bi83]